MNIKSTPLGYFDGTDNRYSGIFITTTIGPTSSESSKARSEQNGDAASKERKIIYWKAPMDPTETMMNRAKARWA